VRKSMMVSGTIDVDAPPSPLPMGAIRRASSGGLELHADGSVARRTLVQAILDAKAQGYEGEPCPECGAMTMVRNGTCLKCMSCGSTSGCS
jgi:ribonucleoside-diphosphate reductase alpha chain